MKKLLINFIGIALIFVFNIVLFSTLYAFDFNDEGRILQGEELSEIYRKAIMNENVSTFKNVLESQNYYHDPNNSIGLIRIKDGAHFINLAFDNGINKLTSNIIYIKINEKEIVLFLEGIINELDGSLNNVELYEIVNGKKVDADAEVTKVSKNFLACVVAGCGAGAFRCLFVGPGYFKCLGIYCAGAFVGCGLAWLLGLM